MMTTGAGASGPIGRELGGYRLLSLVGEGGMGEVYRAEHLATGRLVALKLLRRSLLMSAEGRARFEREGRAAASLDHPAIATVHEVGEAGGQPFIAMEYVQGESLDAWLARPGLTLPQVLRALEQLAEALADAHAKGVVHRDLKPANVVVLPSGAVKLLDFGLAKLVQDDETDSGVRSQLITRPGGVIGTSAYMSPEQARGQRLDRRTDVFSFGVILFEALAGVPPFRGESGIEAVSGVLRDDPLPVLRDRPGLDPELVRMTEKALRKDPAERYQHMDDVAVDLRAMRRALESSSVARGAPLRSAWPWVLTGLAAGVMLAALLFSQRGARAPLPVEGELRLRPLTFEGRSRQPALAPAGDAVAYSSDRAGSFDVYVQAVDGGPPRRLTSSSGDEQDPSFSPHGDLVAYSGDEGRLVVVPASGGVERVVGSGGVEPAWSPDGSAIAFRRGSAIVTVSVQGGAERTLTPAGSAPAVGGPAWSPDGAWVVFLSLSQGQRALSRVPASGGPVVMMSEEPLDVSEPFWSSDGRWLLVTAPAGPGQELWAVPVQRSGRVDGPPVRLLAGLGSYSHPSLSANHRRLAFAVRALDSSVQRLGLGDDLARGPAPLAVAARVHDVEPAHGGGRLAVVVDGVQGTGLALASASGDDLHALEGSGPAAQPAWSPDDTTLAYVRRGADGDRLTTIAAGGGRPRILGPPGQRAAHPAWSPDGHQIAFAALSGTTGSLRVMDAAGGGERTLLETARTPGRTAWSPDGRWVVLTLVDETGRSSIVAVPAGGGPVRPVLNGASAPLWLADGRLVFARVGAPGQADLWTVRLGPELAVVPGSERRLTTLGAGRSVDDERGATTDGRALYFRVVAVTSEQVWLGEVP